MFEENDLVWAKMRFCCPWPGKIIQPPEDVKSKKHHHYVFFFGSDNHAWVRNENIVLHNESMIKKYAKLQNMKNYQTAVKTIIDLSKNSSKCHRPNESSETPDTETTCKVIKQENSFDKSANSSKNKSFQSNPKRFKKKFSLKKLSPVKKLPLTKKPAKKHTHSSDESEPDQSFSLKGLHSGTGDIYSSKRFKSDDGYAQLMLNVPPNLTYSSFTPPETGVLQRKKHELPNTPPIDLACKSKILKKSNEHTKKKFGFLGLGKINQAIVNNLHHLGHTIIIWSQAPTDTNFFVKVAATPADVIDAADITFSCVSDADRANQLVFGNCGILEQLEKHNEERKGYVNMTCMDPKASEAMAAEIRQRGGRYLEAPFSGSRLDVNERTRLILAAGDLSLYEECKICFDAVSKRHKFISDVVGTAVKLILVHNMFLGTVYASVAESLALVTNIGVNGQDFCDLFKDGITDSILEKAMAMLKRQYTCNTPLKHVQYNLYLGQCLADKIAQPTPLFAAANNVYMRCMFMRYHEHDVSAVFEGTKT